MCLFFQVFLSILWGIVLDISGVNSSSARSGPDLRVLDGVAAWCGGLHGSMTLQEALAALGISLNAGTAAIARHYHRSEERPRTVAIYDSEAGNIEAPVLLRRPLCQDVLSHMFTKARAATIWFDSDLADDPSWNVSKSLSNWKIVREVKEIVVVSLATSHQQNDYIEFHFDHLLSHAERMELETLVPTIVRSWAGRQQGLVTQSTVDDRILRARSAAADQKLQWDEPVLGIGNPARLSRAEFRVCVLVSHGLSVSGVASELVLTENTVRSHLRAIYSKTETCSLAELLYRIISSGKDAGEAAFRVA